MSPDTRLYLNYIFYLICIEIYLNKHNNSYGEKDFF